MPTPVTYSVWTQTEVGETWRNSVSLRVRSQSQLCQKTAYSVQSKCRRVPVGSKTVPSPVTVARPLGNALFPVLLHHFSLRHRTKLVAMRCEPWLFNLFYIFSVEVLEDHAGRDERGRAGVRTQGEQGNRGRGPRRTSRYGKRRFDRPDRAMC